MMLPRLIRCTHCGNLIDRGRKIKYRHKCYKCKSYVYIWEVREFYRTFRSERVLVDYDIVKNRICLLKKLHDRELLE